MSSSTTSIAINNTGNPVFFPVLFQHQNGTTGPASLSSHYTVAIVPATAGTVLYAAPPSGPDQGGVGVEYTPTPGFTGTFTLNLTDATDTLTSPTYTVTVSPSPTTPIALVIDVANIINS